MMSSTNIILIGTSAGGLCALSNLLQQFPSDFDVPICIVQHRGTDFDGLLLKELRRFSHLPVVEPSDRQSILPGVFLAPADYHLMIEPGEFRLSTEGSINFARPSIDVLFSTAADAYSHRAIGVVLTGASSDGALGAAIIKKAGGMVIVQDPSEADYPTMPRSVINTVAVDHVLPLRDIGTLLSCLASVKR